MDKYAEVMEDAMVDFDGNGIFAKLADLGVETKHFKDAVYAFRKAVEDWKKYVGSLDVDNNPMIMRYVNDQMQGFEKTLILSEGLPGRKQYRHAVIAPSMFDAYGGSAFPGIGDLLHNIDKLLEQEKKMRVKQLKRHVSDLMIVVKRAAEFLRPVQVL